MINAMVVGVVLVWGLDTLLLIDGINRTVRTIKYLHGFSTETQLLVGMTYMQPIPVVRGVLRRKKNEM